MIDDSLLLLEPHDFTKRRIDEVEFYQKHSIIKISRDAYRQIDCGERAARSAGRAGNSDGIPSGLVETLNDSGPEAVVCGMDFSWRPGSNHEVACPLPPC